MTLNFHKKPQRDFVFHFFFKFLLFLIYFIFFALYFFFQHADAGADPGGAHPARAPPKIGKNMIFWRKIVIFHTKYPKNFRASPRNWKK